MIEDIFEGEEWKLPGIKCYDRLGFVIPDIETFGQLLEDREYVRVQRTRLWWGGEVSTVWLGFDHGFGINEKPLIFESMVFGIRRGNSLDCMRYNTESEARTGHKMLVKEWMFKWSYLNSIIAGLISLLIPKVQKPK